MRRILAGVALVLALGLEARAQPVPPGQKVTLGAANAVAIINTASDTIVTVQIVGTWTGTQSFEGSLDGSTYTATMCTPINSTSTVTTTTAVGVFSCSMVGINFFQVRFSAYGSGSAIVSFQTAYLSGASGSGGGGGGNVSIVQGGNTAAVNGSSQLSVNCANCSGSGVSQVDNSGFVPGTTNFVPVGGEVDDVGTSAVAENSAGAARLTTQRGLHINLRTAAGVETGIAAAPLQVSLANTAANATAVKMDGSAVTQPVSGTVTANMGTVTADPFGANADAASATGSISAKLRFMASTGIPVTAVPADPFGLNADAASATGSISAKLRFIAGTGIPITGTVTVGSHAVTNAGTFATQSAITAASGSIASGAIASGAIASGAIASGAIASGAVASGAYGSDSASFGVGATGAAPPAKGSYMVGLGSGATGGFLLGVPVCDTVKGVNVSTATTTLMVTGVSGRQVRVCAFNLLAAAADNVQFISGTGATCGTGTTGIGGGGTTSGSGYNFAANGGIAAGNGLGQLFTTTSTGDSLCLVTSAAVQLSGMISYTIY